MFQKEKFLVLIFSDKIYIFALFFIFPYILPSNFALALALFFALVFRAKKRARARAKFEGKIYGKMKKRAKKRAKPETTRMPIFALSGHLYGAGGVQSRAILESKSYYDGRLVTG